MPIRIPSRAVVVLAGPSGAGKSAWAARWFRANQIVASDDLRAVVGEHEHDQRAGGDAFEVLDLVVERRAARGLLTVIDTLGMDVERHETWRAVARLQQRPFVVVAFTTDAKTCRARNRTRSRPVPTKVLTGQIERWAELQGELDASGFDAVHRVGGADESDSDVAVVPDLFVGADAGVERQADTPLPLEFGLSISSFSAAADSGDLAVALASVAAEAEDAGFTSIWVMDHLVQIPQVGREWEPMLESTTVLGYLAARTSTARLGTLVTGITYRNIALVAKIVATLDALSGGRAMCGLGAAWFEREHTAYGYRFPPVGERYELLEDALRLLPLMWGPGAPPFEGTHLSTPEAICYPRPVQERVPILVGGSGERRTLRLVAEYADACNLFGDPATVERKIDGLRRHCANLDRDLADVTITHLSTALCALDRTSLAARVDELRGSARSPEQYSESVNAGTPDDHIGRYRAYAEAGVQTAIVSLADVGHPGAVTAFAPVIDAFR